MGTIHATNQNFDRVVLAQSQPVIVDFWASWCGPCRALSPKLEQIASDYDGRLLVVKVNVDEEPELAKRFHVRALPSILVFGQGKEQLRSIGDLSLRVMRTAIDKILETPPQSSDDKAALEKSVSEAQQKLFQQAAAVVGKDQDYLHSIEKLTEVAQPLLDALQTETAPLKEQFDAKLLSEEEFHTQSALIMERLFQEERFKDAAEAYGQMMTAMAQAFAAALDKVDSEDHD